MKSITQKFLSLSLLLALPGCFDFGCCKKQVHEEQVAQTATPKESCNHAGCTHGHAKDMSNNQEAQPCTHEGCNQMHTHDTSPAAHVDCGNPECNHGHLENQEPAVHEDIHSEEK